MKNDAVFGSGGKILKFEGKLELVVSASNFPNLSFYIRFFS